MNKKVKEAFKAGYFESSPELAEIKVSYKTKIKDFKKITSSQPFQSGIFLVHQPLLPEVLPLFLQTL